MEAFKLKIESEEPTKKKFKKKVKKKSQKKIDEQVEEHHENVEVIENPLPPTESVLTEFDVPGFNRIPIETTTGQTIWIAECSICSRQIKTTTNNRLRVHRYDQIFINDLINYKLIKLNICFSII